MDIWDFLTSILSNSIPSVVIMITGLFSLLISGGAWGNKHDDKTKFILRIIGFVFLLLGGLLTILVSIFQIWNSYRPEINNILIFIKPAISKQTIFIFILFLIGVILIRQLVIIRKEKSYKLTFQPVLDKGEGDANIIVNNISKKTINCQARLEGFFLSGKEMNVNELNPNAEALNWKRETGGIPGVINILSGIPEILRLASIYGDKIMFEFGKSGIEFDLDEEYKVIIGFYRIKGAGFVRFGEFNGKLKSLINPKDDIVELEWIDSKVKK